MAMFIQEKRPRTRREMAEFKKRVRAKHTDSKTIRTLMRAYKNGAHFVDYNEFNACTTPEARYRWELYNFMLTTHRLRLRRAVDLQVDFAKLTDEERAELAAPIRRGK